MDWLILLKIAIVYFFILGLMKFMGKREIGQLSLFDFVIILVIADIAVIGIESEDHPFYNYLLGIFLLGLIQKILAKIMLKIPKLREVFDGRDSIIVFEGKLNLKEMTKQSYNIDDLITQLRLKNINSLSQVRYVILEPNGEISVFKYSDNEIGAATGSKIGSRKNSQILNQTNANIVPLPVIISGKVDTRNLKLLKLTEPWLQEEIQKQGYAKIEDIYYANYENDGLFIVQIGDF
ncbi:MAG: DUF421 domain-containing protein [Acholeplasmataceae bacterium]|nr:DUF421 domain-containing protein [Acholeplasmataceae bacterium]